MRIFGRSSALDTAFASLKEALPTKPRINSKVFTQKLPNAISGLTTLQSTKENKIRLGFRVGSMPLKDINEKLKNSFGEIKTKGASRQSSSASNKDRRELQALVSDVLVQAKKLETLADKIRRDINGNEKHSGLNERISFEPELYAIYKDLIAESKSAKNKIYDTMQDNGYSRQHGGLQYGVGLSKKEHDNMIKGLNRIKLSMQSKFRFAEQKIDNLKRNLA
ncbi:hypothetical protein [Mycetohabitans sp. B6]|nr:hypothetical protein [Mycetohabitans sp. B6]MCG1046276.1 hypothetical protein [Mycetohabitans sp. B6]